MPQTLLKIMDFSQFGWRQTDKNVWVGSEDGNPGFRASREAVSLMFAAAGILRKQNPMTLRGLYYALFGAKWLTNCDASYNRLKTVMVDARKWGIVKWNWIDDATREPHVVGQWADLADFLGDVRNAYRRDRWQDQEVYVEVLIEKRTGISQAKRICRDYGITVSSGNGYGGWSSIYEMAQRFGKRQKEGKKCHLLYVGDYDPSGLHMSEADLPKRLSFFVGSELQTMPRITRLGVGREDIDRYTLPEAPGKQTDSRAPWMEENYGELIQVEMDALWSHTDENIFEEKLVEAIEEIIDMDVHADTLEREEEEDATLADLIDQFKGDDGGDE